LVKSALIDSEGAPGGPGSDAGPVDKADQLEQQRAVLDEGEEDHPHDPSHTRWP
jgi:hypothetical protein